MAITSNSKDNTKVVDRTEAINNIEVIPTLFTSLGLLDEVGVSADSITFDVKENSLSVLTDHKRNVAQVNSLEEQGYKVHTLAIGHFPIESTITREQLAQNRGFGKAGRDSVAEAIVAELEQHTEHHQYHRDFMFARALNGVVEYENFPSVDFYTEFGISKPTESLDLSADVATSTLSAVVNAATSKAKQGYKGGKRIRGYYGLCSAAFFDALVGSPAFREVYVNVDAAPNPLRDAMPEVAGQYRAVNFAGVTWVRIDDEFTQQDGSKVSAIADKKCLLVPNVSLGKAYYGPSKTLSGLGQVGQRMFASTFRDERDRFITTDSEANILPIVEQIGAIVEITDTSA